MPDRCVNARQGAGIEQIGQRTFESSYGGRPALVAPTALGRALDPGEVTKRRADDAVDVDERPRLKYHRANHARTNELAGRSWTRFVTDAKLDIRCHSSSSSIRAKAFSRTTSAVGSPTSLISSV